MPAKPILCYFDTIQMNIFFDTSRKKCFCDFAKGELHLHNTKIKGYAAFLYSGNWRK